MRPSHSLAAALALIAVQAAPARAQEVDAKMWAADVRELDRSDSPARVRAYHGDAVWSSYDRAARTFTVRLTGGEVQFTSPHYADPDIGRGPDGRPLVVVARDGRIESAGRTLVRTAGTASVVTVWRNTLAWVRDGRVYAARIGGRARRVDLPGSAREVELFGRTLAAVVAHGGREQVWLQRLNGDKRRLVRDMPVAPGRLFLGLTFDHTRLYFAQTCQGCDGPARAFRYAGGRFAVAPPPTDLSGFGFSNGTGYWARVVAKASGETVTLIETAPLTFT